MKLKDLNKAIELREEYGTWNSIARNMKSNIKTVTGEHLYEVPVTIQVGTKGTLGSFTMVDTLKHCSDDILKEYEKHLAYVERELKRVTNELKVLGVTV